MKRFEQFVDLQEHCGICIEQGDDNEMTMYVNGFAAGARSTANVPMNALELLHLSLVATAAAKHLILRDAARAELKRRSIHAEQLQITEDVLSMNHPDAEWKDSAQEQKTVLAGEEVANA